MKRETYLRCYFESLTIKPYQTYNLSKVGMTSETAIKAMQAYNTDKEHAPDEQRTYVIDGYVLEMTSSIWKDDFPIIPDVIRITKAT